MTVQATNYDGTANYTLLQTTDVKNSLSDSSTNLPLAASQGKALNTRLNTIETAVYTQLVSDSYGFSVYACKIGKVVIFNLAGTNSAFLTTHTIPLPSAYAADGVYHVHTIAKNGSSVHHAEVTYAGSTITIAPIDFTWGDQRYLQAQWVVTTR